MRVIEGENELRLTCSRSASGGIALLRCETQDDIVRLPDEIDGVPVTEVGAYVLSERVPDLTGKDTSLSVLPAAARSRSTMRRLSARLRSRRMQKVLAVMHFITAETLNALN